MKINLNNVFRYFRFSLEIEDILAIRVKFSDIRKATQLDIIQKINKDFNDCPKKYHSFDIRLNSPFNKWILIELEDKKYDLCFKHIIYLEKAIAFCKTNRKSLKYIVKLDTSESFTLHKAPRYQYAIFINMILNSSNEYVPLFILNFHSRDAHDTQLSTEIILEQLKEYLSQDYDEQILSSISLRKPLLSINPIVMEEHNCPDIDITFDNIADFKIKSSEYIRQNNIELNKIKQGIFFCASPPNMAFGLLKIYATVLKNGANDLLKSFFKVAQSKVTDSLVDSANIVTTSEIIDSYGKHIGAFDSKYSLAATQRIALSYFTNAKNIILPVNGAPGTGKTSLLRCIFGQYLVESALVSYQNYLKDKTINFRTPIVCSSTNNQALFNISEGIDLSFRDQAQNSILYRRWLGNIDELQKESIIKNKTLNNILIKKDFLATFLVPSIKNNKHHDLELSKEDINAIISIFSNNADYYASCFDKYKPNYIDKNASLTTQLEKIIAYFGQKIVDNIKVISQKEGDFSKLANFEKQIFNKYSKKYSVQKIQKSLSYIINNPQLIAEKIATLVNYELELEKIEAKVIEYTDQSNKIVQAIFPAKNKLSLIEAVNTLANVSIDDMNAEIKSTYACILATEVDIIKDELATQSIMLRQSSNILVKLLYKLSLGSLQKKITQAKLDAGKKIKAAKEKLLLEAQEMALNKLDYLRQKISKINTLYEKILATRTNINNKITVINDYLNNKFILNRIDINELLSYMPDLNKANTIKNNKALFDVKERTDNFYYAMHLLEGLFFIGKTPLDHVLCPICHRGSIRQADNPNLFKCNQCSAKYSKNNINHINLKLLDKEVMLIIRHRQYRINNITYTISCNKNWINIIEVTSKDNLKNALDFQQLLPIFPLINLTCNSFGSIVANSSGDVPKDLFDFVLIDEAGTILPSKMIILYCAKRCMLFGDIMQLKPVFNYNYKVELGLINNFVSDINEIKTINNYFSCANNENIVNITNNAMQIANNAVQIILPYNYSKLSGDIWLKEHYRCKNPIVAIANELTYFGEIKPMAGDNGHLIFVESLGFRTKYNTNYTEAEAIVNYIQAQQETFCRLLNVSLEEYYEAIGIITPFVNQEQLIIDLLKKTQISHKPKVGTVHKFQGSECRIIIFSTVYDNTSTADKLFFNREDTSMINVAVTRARDVFICFGYKELLNTPNTYSGLMVSKIFFHQNKL